MSVNTLDDYINVSIGGFNNCKSDTVIVNGNGAVVFISLLAFNSVINAIKPLFNSVERIKNKSGVKLSPIERKMVAQI